MRTRTNMAAGMVPTLRKIVSTYLVLHVLSVLGVEVLSPYLLVMFPVPFVLYGGIQAVVLFSHINRESPVFRPAVLYAFALVETGYTVTLAAAAAYGHFDACLPCLRGTRFADPEFFFFYYSLVPNAMFAIAVLAAAVAYGVGLLLREK